MPAPKHMKPIWLRIVNSIERDERGCWIWQYRINRGGYSQMKHNGRNAHAARVSYEAFRGPIPGGLDIDHLCYVASCVNPDHLEPVTKLENQQRRAALRTHCRWGHEYNDENTYNGAPTRVCRACNRAASARYRYAARKKAAA